MAEFAHPETEEREQQPVRRVAAPLVVGAADDRAEVDADRVADEVIGRLQGGEAGESHIHDGCHGVARIAAPAPAAAGAPEVGYEGGAISDDLTGRIEAKRGTGSALPDGVRSRMEAGFGRSLADVRVHTDGESANLNRSISARAFTTGNDIFFGAGEFSPDSAAGERVLAHEIAHTQQQAGGAKRLHRLWDFKSSKLKTERATDIRTLSANAVWFLKDGDGDEIVVKPDDQPLGLGQMADALHKKIGGTDSVKTRKLTKNEQLGVDNILEIQSMSGSLNESWTKRGDLLKQSDPQIDATEDSKEVAKDNAQKLLWDKTKNVVAMTVAEGEGADKLSATPEKGGDSPYRKMLTNAKHLQQLGKVAAVDFLYGNADRAITGNFGNWFVSMEDPNGKLMLLDQIDPGSGPRTGTAGFYTMPQSQWEAEIGFEFGNAKRNTLLWPMLGRIQGKDATIMDWVDEKMEGGQKRSDFMLEHLNAGFVEASKRIVKVFGARKWQLLGAGADKKAVKKAAKSAALTDGKGENDYYDQLKGRAAYIKKNLK